MPTEDANNGISQQQGNAKPSNAQKQPEFYWPFRWLQYLTRFAQREHAKHSGKRDYNNSADADLLRALRRANACYQRFISNFTANRVIAFFTIVMAGTTLYQWNAMENQNEIMRGQMRQTDDSIKLTRETAQNQLRAYLAIRVFIKSIDEKKAAGEYDVAYEIHFKNYGQTPADEISVPVFCQAIDKTGEVRTATGGCDDLPEGPLDLAPLQEHVITKFESFTKTEFDECREGSKAWNIHIITKYRDIYGIVQTKEQAFRRGGGNGFDIGEVQGAEDAGIDEAGQKGIDDPGPAPVDDAMPPERQPAETLPSGHMQEPKHEDRSVLTPPGGVGVADDYQGELVPLASPDKP